MDNFTTNTTPRQINVNPSLTLNFKTNEKGLIEYINDNLSTLAGFEEYELIYEPMDISLHSDMPKTIIEMIHESLKDEKTIKAYLKMQTKDKHFFWLFSEFTTKEDLTNQKAHYNKSYAVPDEVIYRMDALYEILKRIEMKTGDTKTSSRYLKGYLEERGKNYNTYIEETINPAKPEVSSQKPAKEKASLFKRIFGNK